MKLVKRFITFAFSLFGYYATLIVVHKSHIKTIEISEETQIHFPYKIVDYLKPRKV